MTINLHIEELLLDGIALLPSQKAQLMSAINANLGELLAEKGLGLAVQSIDVPRAAFGGSILINEQAGVAALGRSIAGAVYSGIGRGLEQ